MKTSGLSQIIKQIRSDALSPFQTKVKQSIKKPLSGI
jgi:hypothetical protein